MKHSSSKSRARAEITVPFPTKADVQAFHCALKPETETSKTRRALVRISGRGRTLTMKFLADDLVALRAMVNSYLRLVASWRRLSERLAKPK